MRCVLLLALVLAQGALALDDDWEVDANRQDNRWVSEFAADNAGADTGIAVDVCADLNAGDLCSLCADNDLDCVEAQVLQSCQWSSVGLSDSEEDYLVCTPVITTTTAKPLRAADDDDEDETAELPVWAIVCIVVGSVAVAAACCVQSMYRKQRKPKASNRVAVRKGVYGGGLPQAWNKL